MRLLVTGISGFVGRTLAELSSGGEHVLAGTYVEGHEPRIDLELYRANLLDPAALTAVVEGFRPDRIVHLAGLSHVGDSFKQPDRYREINVGGTENLVRAAAGLPIVLASSSEVYGNLPEAEQPIGEDREPNPHSPYGESKVAAEHLVLAAGGIVVRSFNLIGAGQDASFALPSFARQLARIQSESLDPVLRVGNLEARRDFLHVDDAAAGYLAVAEQAAPGTVYNLGSGRAHRMRDLLERLIRISGLSVDVEVDPAKFRPADALLRVADVTRIRALGWAPRRDVDSALEEIWRAVSTRE